MSTTTHCGLTRVNLRVTGVSPRVISDYRKLRKFGFSRQDVNLIIMGLVSASREGVIDVRREPA